MTSALTAIVTGRVQLVMYRDFVQRNATALGLVGVVMNLPDNTVRVVAEGPKDKLDELVKRLRVGPLLAKVESVTVQWGDPRREWRDFTIQYT